MEQILRTYEAWRQFVSIGRLPETQLRPVVFRSWERAHQQGADPRRFRAELLSPLETERRIEANADFIRLARPYLRALSAAAGAERHAAMLSDDQGVVIGTLGDNETIHGPEPVPPPGAILTEAFSGANGIGTPLAERRYVELVATEHFIAGFHPFTCQGIPLRGPENALVGVLSTSVRTQHASVRLREILLAAARGIEAELFATLLSRRLKAFVAEERDEVASLEKFQQDILQIITASRLRLALSALSLAQDRVERARTLITEAQAGIHKFL